MPSMKAITVAATLAAGVAAYPKNLESRNDLDFAPEDLEVLFGRDIDIDFEDLELAARDLDLDAEDLDILVTRAFLGGLAVQPKRVTPSAYELRYSQERQTGGQNRYTGTKARDYTQVSPPSMDIPIPAKRDLGMKGIAARGFYDALLGQDSLSRRSPGFGSSVGKFAKSAFKYGKKANDFYNDNQDTIKSVGHGAKKVMDKVGGGGGGGGGNRSPPPQRIGTVMRNPPPQQQQNYDPAMQALMPSGGGDSGYGYSDPAGMVGARSLFDEEDPEVWY